jgi:hypothetical protein
MYKVAIPSYKRADALRLKTLAMLKKGKVPASRVYIFVANKEEKKQYEAVIPKELYKELVVGKIGIAPQRIFIRNYFKEGEHIVSIDDDVEEIQKLSGEVLVQLRDVNKFFIDAFKKVIREGLYLWGIYPVRNPFFMNHSNKPVSTGLKFIIGALHGYIVRHTKSLDPNKQSEGKEDYEQGILYYNKDGGVMRYNNITIKTKFLAKGGLGEEKERFEINRKAAEYLQKTYPEYVTIFHRKSGMTEIRLRDSTLKQKLTKKKTDLKKGTRHQKSRKLKN